MKSQYSANTKRARPLLGLLAVIAMVCVAMVAPPAGANPSESSVVDLPDVPAPRIDSGISVAEMQDLRTLASQSGMTIDEAIERYAWNDNFSLAVHLIRDGMPDSFAGAAIVDSRTAWIGFADSQPEDAAEVIAEFGDHFGNIDVDIRTGVGFTEVEIQKAIAAAHFAVFEHDGVEDAITSFDFDSKTIEIVVSKSDTASKAVTTMELEQIADAAVNRTIDRNPASLIAVSVAEANTRVLGGDDSSSYHWGGEALSTCTSGFTVRTDSSTSGSRGVATAGHCNDTQSDDGDSLTIQDSYDGYYGDYQWHTGPDTVQDEFYSGTTTSLEAYPRDVSSVGYALEGQSVCKNGKAGYKDCGEVRKDSVCHGGNCYMQQMGSRLAVSGDSGGPIFWSNTAYGLHEGWMYDPSWPWDRDTYSRAIYNLDWAIGVHIATS